jgi:hypothetical protein
VNQTTNRLFKFITGYRSFFKSSHHAVTEFGLIKWLPALVVFNKTRHHQFSRLKRCETLVASQALTAPTNLPAITRKTRVDYLGFFMGAEWTMHGW